jgi:hypothetical protein
MIWCGGLGVVIGALVNKAFAFFIDSYVLHR